MIQRLKRVLFKVILVFVALGLIALMLGVFINYKVKHDTADDILYTALNYDGITDSSLDKLKAFGADCILVLGAGIEDDETPTPMLKDRLDLGIELYKKGTAPKLLLSGDNGQINHNEIHVMLNYAKNAGVPEEDIFCDHAGFSTYESMYRADSIFEIKRAIVVTQKYHEYRSIYIGQALGLDVVGAASDQDRYSGQGYREFREILARTKDFFKSAVKAQPTYGGEAIPISGSGVTSHGE